MVTKSIFIMAGGTGGHVFPGLALANEMQKRDAQVQWLGTQAGIEARLVPAANIPLHFLSVRGVRGKGWRSVMRAPWNIARAIGEALRVLRAHRPQLVVGMGGFVSGPGGVAAKLLGIPLVLHEQNAIAGTTNKLLARLATRTLTAFPGALPHAECVGNPVRESIENLPEPAQRFAARDERCHLLIVGGSRGALAINELLPRALTAMPRVARVKIWHQTGEGKHVATEEAYRQLGIDARVAPFIDDMAEALAWADFVVCRSGALTVSELAAAGVGALFIPFPHAIDDHQTANAQVLARVGAARVLQQAQATPERVAEELNKVLFDREKLLSLAQSARAVAQVRAARRVAEVCEEVMHG